MGIARAVPRISWAQADIPTVQETTMSYGAVAMFLGAILFRGPGENSGNGHGKEVGCDEFTVSDRLADRRARRLAPGDPVLIEDDYYRFLNQPRD